MKTRVKPTKSNEHPRSVRWRGENLDRARQLADREDRTLNDFLNLTVERMWKKLPVTEQIIPR